MESYNHSNNVLENTQSECDGDVIEIFPFDEYDWNRGKLRASLSWLLSKAYPNNIPKELQDPFYLTTDDQLILRPVMVNLMTSSELYCQACSNMFPETHTQWQGHWSIIQVLSRKGIYIADVQDSSVTETVLVQTAPIRLKAHLALIDALMKAYTCEVASVEKVVKAVRRFTTFPASSELPDTPEEALLFWINKICTVLRTDGVSTAGVEGVIEGEAGQKVRVLGKSMICREPIQVPVLKNLMTDIGDGCSIAAVIAFYRPHLLNVKDLCLKKGIGIADSLHNLRRIEQFCQHHLPWKCFHLSYEDLLYSHEGMKPNFIAFLADLFFCFEGPGSVQATDSVLTEAKPPKEKTEVLAAAGKVIPNVPVSLVTKRSFQRQSLEETANNLGMGRSAASSPSVHQPLLPRRGRRSIPQEEARISGSPQIVRRSGRRTVSLCSPQDRDMVHRSVLAWQDDQKIPHRSDERDSISGGRRDLLANVSIDSELNESFNSNNNFSLDLSELDTPRFPNSAAYDPSHKDYMELESVTTGQSRFSSSPQQYTDYRSSRTPTVSHADHKRELLLPAMIKPTKERETISKAQERGDSRMIGKRKVPSPAPPAPQHSQPSQEQTQQPADSDDLDVSLSESSDETNVSSLAPTSSTVSSFTLEDPGSTVESPRAAVIPSSRDLTLPAHQYAADSSREGSISSSGDYSDHESKKIHQEYKAKESSLAISPAVSTSDTSVGIRLIPTSSGLQQHSNSTDGAEEMVISKSPSSTTSFAELKRLREQLGHGHDIDTNRGAGNITTPSKEQQGDIDLGLHSPLDAPSGGVAETNGIDLGLSELQQLRLKLEQKRKEIEKKKHRQELQQNKMRQRLGKAAFMRVVSKHLEGSDEDELCDLPDTRRPEFLPSSTQAQLQARLGHPVSGMYRGQTHAPQYPVQMNIGSGSQSAFTDWQTQSLLSKVGGAAAHRPGNLNQAQQQFLMSRAGASGAVPAALNSSALAHAPIPRPFSREGIQQTIDNVRNKWFKTGSNVSAGGKSRDGDGIEGYSYRPLGHDDIDGDSVRALEHSQGLSRSYLESPSLGTSQNTPTHSVTPPIPIPAREATSSPSAVSEVDNQDYDSSLDRLNSSLTELQGEIMRLSLQQEKRGLVQPSVSMIGSGQREASSSILASSHHGILQEPQYVPEKSVTKHEALSSQQHATTVSYMHDSDLTADLNKFQPSLMNSSQSSSFKSELVPEALRQHTGEADSESASATMDNFFVSLGDASPKQPKVISKEHIVSRKPPFPSKEESAMPSESTAHVSSTAEITADVAAALASLTVLDTSLQTSAHACEDLSPKVGFIIKEEAALVREQVIEDEMQKKRIKLMEMQRKRKEEQEKKRTEKEEEMAKKHEEKQLKEEEQERKKAEEKARREVIFQQYLQKKQEDEEVPAKPRSKKRESSASKQRPKSMFVKSKAMTPEPGALAPDSVSSSQEDLTDRAHPPGRSAPNIMSTMRSSYHARLPQPVQIRKAVSCNILQGTSDGTLGAASNRHRPPSPDLYRTKQRHRGSSQDSGSETGSGSNPGSDYAGPKLFVKPSARSNRHIIVNAISHCCLAGSVNTDLKNKVLEELSKCEANHFLVLFRDAGCQYRGLYIFYPETEEAFKVHGVGPKHITNDLCEKFYKYNSGGKSFSEITSTKHLSVSVDAVVLHSSVWKSGKAVGKR